MHITAIIMERLPVVHAIQKAHNLRSVARWTSVTSSSRNSGMRLLQAPNLSQTASFFVEIVVRLLYDCNFQNIEGVGRRQGGNEFMEFLEFFELIRTKSHADKNFRNDCNRQSRSKRTLVIEFLISYHHHRTYSTNLSYICFRMS